MNKGQFIYDIPERKMPATQELASGEEWIIEIPYAFIRPNGIRIDIPASGQGSVSNMLLAPVWTTDYGSIPKVVQNVFSPTEYGDAYVMHDWLYSCEMFDRTTCDSILLEGLCASAAKSWWISRNTIWSAVRVGGWYKWSQHDPKTIATMREYAKITAKLPAS